MKKDLETKRAANRPHFKVADRSQIGVVMRYSIVLAAVVLCGVLASSAAAGDHYVRGYLRSDGTYVPGYFRSSADGNFYNNYSTRGNVNPYTGTVGTRQYPSYSGSGYYSGYGSGSSYGSYSGYSPSYTSPSYQSYTPTYNFGASNYYYSPSCYGSYDYGSGGFVVRYDR